MRTAATLTLGFLSTWLWVGTASAATSSSRERSALTPEACRFAVAPELQSLTRCYRLTVPRNYERPSEGTFDLAVAVQGAAAPSRGRTPLLLLHGGPGGRGVVAAAGRRAVSFSPGVDTIFLDQRGNGLSEPFTCNDIELNTREAIAGPGDGFSTVWRINEPYARCRGRFAAAGLRPEHFGTRVTTRDVEQLRRALGIARWDVLSVSYGTIVALDLLAASPATIRSVVLDSPVWLVPNSETAAAEFERPVLNIFAACAADAACARAYPRLKQDFKTTFQTLDAQPLVVPLDPKASHGLAEANINGMELEYLLRRLMRSATGIASIPQTLEAARKRDVKGLQPLVSSALEAVPDSNTMGRPAVMCRDVAELSEVRPPTRAWDFGQLYGVCRLWGPVGQAPRVPTGGNARVLILVGELDPYYEPPVVKKIEQRFGARARTLMFPAATHGVWSRGCSQQIVAAFFADPLANLDASCIEALPPFDFSKGAEAKSTP